ncbi:peptide chain release factor 2 [Acidobacteriota bacterium]
MESELERRYQEIKEKVQALRGFLEVEKKQEENKKIDEQLAGPDIWNLTEKTQSLLKSRQRNEESIRVIQDFEARVEEGDVLLELDREGEDVEQDFRLFLKKTEGDLQEQELKAVLSGDHDKGDAIVALHSGAGGTESQDWAQMLLRMYLRWAEAAGFNARIIDSLAGEEAGLKSATFTLQGEYAYGYMKSEIGVHRLVRLSPFDAKNRRHTSFASLFVYADIDASIDIDIQESDLRIDTYRSSGAGGQHVNVTDSAVRITHLPTGIVVQCQNERSQHRNRDTAMKVLRARLYERALDERKKEQEELEESKMEIAWGSQIRSYILHPYKMVKDHRTGLEMANAERVLDGNIDDFIRAYLFSQTARRSAR